MVRGLLPTSSSWAGIPGRPGSRATGPACAPVHSRASPGAARAVEPWQSRRSCRSARQGTDARDGRQCRAVMRAGAVRGGDARAATRRARASGRLPRDRRRPGCERCRRERARRCRSRRLAVRTDGARPRRDTLGGGASPWSGPTEATRQALLRRAGSGVFISAALRSARGCCCGPRRARRPIVSLPAGSVAAARRLRRDVRWRERQHWRVISARQTTGPIAFQVHRYSPAHHPAICGGSGGPWARGREVLKDHAGVGAARKLAPIQLPETRRSGRSLACAHEHGGRCNGFCGLLQ
jgi:hypothetical protein